MILHEQIKNNIKESMKRGDKVRLEVMRGLVTAFTNELVATGKTPQDMLTDEEAIKVITREVFIDCGGDMIAKQHHNAISI